MSLASDEQSFGDELARLLNKYSKEGKSNTPDFVLVEYIRKQLEAWNVAVRLREKWYGRPPTHDQLAEKQAFANVEAPTATFGVGGST